MKTRGFAWPLVALLGCRAESIEPDEDVDVASEGEDAEDERVRFYEDVAPILATACNGCHEEGGVAPFALDTYEDALLWAEAIAVVTEARTMPPFNINNDGSCNEFSDARWLDDDQIATLRAWVEDGTPEGDATLGMPQAPPPTELRGERIVSLQTPPDYTPVPQAIEAAMFDDYQCFLVDPELTEDAFLVGFDVVPGDARVVHHVLAFNVDPTRMVNGQSNADLMAELDAADDRPGWDCYAAAGDGVWIEGVPVTWAPGAGATHYPEGTGIRIGAGQQLVVQMHYSLIDAEPVADGTEIRLALAEEVEREGTMVLVDGFLMSLLTGAASLPPGEEKATFAWDVELEDMPNLHMDLTNAELLGILPHMHQRGRRMTVDLVPAESDATTCAADVDRWDFSWQQSYFYAQPLPVAPKDRLAVTCEYDTRSDADPIGPGFGTDDEMCLVGLFLAQRP